MRTQIITVNNKKYKLQHPGNREWLRLKDRLMKISGEGNIQIDTESLLDYCFEHVVFPEEGPQITLDSCNERELEEVWAVVLLPFFRGTLSADYSYPVKPKGPNKPK